MDSKTETRREFCAHACYAAALAALSPILQACGGSSSPTAPSNISPLPTIAATASAAGLVVPVGPNSALSGVGSMALVQAQGRFFLVAHTGQDAFTALDGTCTHERCTITGFSNQNYVCPCHGSQFTNSGQVLNGPAARPLNIFDTRVANNELTILV